MIAWRRGVREVELARAAERTGPRCPDCGRRWPLVDVEAAFRHLPVCPARLAKVAS